MNKEIAILKLLLLLALAFFLTVSFSAESVPKVKVVEAVPKVEAVPEPVIEEGKANPNKIKDEDSTIPSALDSSLIKAEKDLVDKNCRMINGKVKCKNKSVKRKTID